MKSEELLKQLQKAHSKFQEALTFEDTEALRESLIQRFEYTFELAWKVMSSILHDEGIGKTGVKTILRAAAQIELIDNPVQWLHFADARNKSSHIYRENIAIEVASTARCGFSDAVGSLIHKALKKTHDNM
jgi:nucleotidyltransferase substrate binding protein (TIGR01987 family)